MGIIADLLVFTKHPRCGLVAQIEPDSFADAHKMLTAMIQPGVDGHAVFLSWCPLPEDYATVFTEALAAKLQVHYASH